MSKETNKIKLIYLDKNKYKQQQQKCIRYMFCIHMHMDAIESLSVKVWWIHVFDNHSYTPFLACKSPKALYLSQN